MGRCVRQLLVWLAAAWLLLLPAAHAAGDGLSNEEAAKIANMVDQITHNCGKIRRNAARSAARSDPLLSRLGVLDETGFSGEGNNFGASINCTNAFQQQAEMLCTDIGYARHSRWGYAFSAELKRPQRFKNWSW
jgi:hypothetical protein